ncbi:alpha/beta hydrolase family protein [Pseudomonas sp. LB1P83]
MKVALLIGCTLLMIAGCASQQTARAPDPQSAKFHTIYIDGYGNLLDPRTGEPIATSSDPKAIHDEEALYANAILTDFKKHKSENPKLKLVLFIHGGLNEFEAATRRATQYTALMMKDDLYPVFIGWDSGFMTNYWDHLVKIRKGLNRPILGPISAPFVLLEDVGRSIVRIPSSMFKEVTDPLVVTKSVHTEAEVDYQARAKLLKAEGFAVINRPPYVGVGSDYYTVWNPIKVLAAPFVDGFGTGSWDGMLRRTDLVLSKSSAFEGDMAGEADSIKLDAPRYADTAVTTFLKRYEADPSLKGSEIDLIGHSMGAIVAVNVLARHGDLNIRNLVFMGAAAKIKDLENVVSPWLQVHKSAQFWNLSLDPYREIGENTFYDFAPRGSLLNWIDFTFGEVNSYKDRTAGSWWNITRLAEDVFPLQNGTVSLRARVHLTRFPIGEKCQWPQKHGEFDDYFFWKEAFWQAQPKRFVGEECSALFAHE